MLLVSGVFPRGSGTRSAVGSEIHDVGSRSRPASAPLARLIERTGSLDSPDFRRCQRVRKPIHDQRYFPTTRTPCDSTFPVREGSSWRRVHSAGRDLYRLNEVVSTSLRLERRRPRPQRRSRSTTAARCPPCRRCQALHRCGSGVDGVRSPTALRYVQEPAVLAEDRDHRQVAVCVASSSAARSRSPAGSSEYLSFPK